MVPELAMVTSMSMVSVTPGFTVQVSIADIVASEVIVVSVTNVIEEAVKTIVPTKPTATPVFASLIDTPFIALPPLLVVISAVQSTPPLVVKTIVPAPPTATPLQMLDVLKPKEMVKSSFQT